MHESKEHGFRLTVQDGSLRSPIGPITVQEFAQVVRCEDNGQDYLVKSVVDCRPSGATFLDKPLLMDFRTEEISSIDISGVEQVRSSWGSGKLRQRWRTLDSLFCHTCVNL